MRSQLKTGTKAGDPSQIGARVRTVVVRARERARGMTRWSAAR